MSPTGPGMTAASTDGWLGRLGLAYRSPQEVAARWRSGGGRVVGIFGATAPRELVSAAGMLPVPLDPGPLERGERVPEGLGGERAGGLSEEISAGLRGELSDGALALLSALLGGRLEWLDALLIGRDSEAHTKLFYVIRELAAEPELAPLIPPFAFSDVLCLPLRTSAVYNRIRLRQLAETVAAWGGAEVDAGALRTAIEADARTKRGLGELRDLQRRGLVSARDALVAAGGAQVLPSTEAQAALSQAVRVARSWEPAVAGAPRIFVTGSAPQPDIYAVIEAGGLRIVGDDHEWGSDDLEASADSEDPIDRLADRCQYLSPGSARAGLERVGRSVARVRELGADAVLQLILPGDEASAWELPELRTLLEGLPVVSVQLDSGPCEEPLQRAAASLLQLLGPAAGSRQPSAEATRG